MSIVQNPHMSHEAPPGVSPADRSEPLGPNFGETAPVREAPTTPQGRKGTAPYGTENYESLQVFERSSDQWDSYLWSIDPKQNGGTVQVAGRQKGRKSVTLSVPTALPNGWTPVQVIFASTEDGAQNQINGAILNPGDSVTIYTEAQVYIGLASGETTGFVQVITESNPAGGGL